jgi:hypothetical protein
MDCVEGETYAGRRAALDVDFAGTVMVNVTFAELEPLCGAEVG